MKKLSIKKFRTLLVVGVVLVFLSASVVPAAGSNELFIYKDPRYVEDEGRADNRGVIHGAEPVRTRSGALYQGWALEFDGEDDWVDISSSHDIYDTDSFTVSLWARSSSGGKQPVMEDRSDGERRYSLRLTKERLSFGIGKKGEGSSLADNRDFSRWHHIVAVYDSEAGEQALYIDGELSGSTYTNVSLPTGGAHCIGRSNPETPAWQTDYFFKGYVGRTQYYRSALSEEEASDLYDYNYIEKTPLSSWNMEGVAPDDTSRTFFYVYPFALGASLILLAYYSYTQFEDKYDFEIK
ncbi:MAG: LamG domain-containing protein [Candidatus Thermoplasmatota archaeon]